MLLLTTNSYALTINNYNRFCEDGKLMNVEIKFNDVVAKYNKYGHYQLGDDLMPTGDLSDPLSNEGDRDMAHIAVQSDTTFKIYGELDEEEMDYSFYDLEDVSASELKVYELNAKLEALHVGNQVQERSGFGKYNLRNGKNLIAFIKFAYEFYKNSSGEYRVGVKDDKLFKDTPAAGYPVCPMELLEEYAGLNSTSAVILENDFEGKFKDCISKWEYIGNKELSNSDKIFETLEDIYMGLVYLYPALKVLQSRESVKNPDGLKQFICTVAKNEAINFIRKDSHLVKSELIDEMYGESDKVNDVLNILEPLLSNKEVIVVYYKAIFEMTWDEITKETGIPSSTARLIYKQAKDKLKKELRYV